MAETRVWTGTEAVNSSKLSVTAFRRLLERGYRSLMEMKVESSLFRVPF